MTKEADDVCFVGVEGRIGDFLEPANAAGGGQQEVGAFKEGLGREGRGKARRGNEGLFRSDEAEALLAIEFPLSR